jgi:hypothetical protein
VWLPELPADCHLGESRGEERLDRRLTFACASRKLEAVDASGHDDIREQEVNFRNGELSSAAAAPSASMT